MPKYQYNEKTKQNKIKQITTAEKYSILKETKRLKKHEN